MNFLKSIAAAGLMFAATAGLSGAGQAMPIAAASVASDNGLVIQVQQQQRRRGGGNNANNNNRPNNNNNNRNNNRNNDARAAAIAAGVLGVIGGIIASQNQPQYVEEPVYEDRRYRRHRSDFRGRPCYHGTFIDYRGLRRCR